ncbi:cobyrinate a,c-diamide synthase, partial [Nostocoides japonicum]|uniref:cobyrinate a,c-diamide synthase n=1 Tax=Nostocoides japonicum TaxID=99481 RepID=UPI00065C04CB
MTPVPLPRVVVAAPASGHGKTTVATGLMAALRQRGHVVSGHKVGPDFIDPGYHALATHRPGRNLDPHLVGVDRVEPLLVHGARGADIAVIEGVMGLFDGRLGHDGFASTAHVAALTASPVILVVDVSHASRSVAALVHGLRSFDPSVRVAGVVVNKAGSARHAAEVLDALAPLGIPVIGVLQRDDGIVAPSRHLGLVPAAERPEAAATLDRLAARVATAVDLDAVVEIARTAPPLATRGWRPDEEVEAPAGHRPTVAVAGGRAFTFRYAETDELLRAAGCDVVPFDPLTDAELPPGTSGLYLGGGFPEVYAGDLSSNDRLRAAVRDAVRSGMPTVAECAGLLYLCGSLEGRPMVGALDAEARMTSRLTLGYRDAVVATDHLAGRAGAAVTGHEFHRTTVTPTAADPAAYLIEDRRAGFATPTLSASYLHVHWAGHPAMAARFADAARQFASSTPAAASSSRATRVVVERSGDPGDEPVESPLTYHGDRELGDGLVDLAVNVHPEGPPAWLVEALSESLRDVARYPDQSTAADALATLHGRPVREVLVTAGAAEAFTLLARARRWQRPVVVHPQFTEPDAALAAAGHRPHHVVCRPEDGFALRPEEIPGDADLVVVGNPTNPTGVLHDETTLRGLLRPGRTVVVDEAFMDTVPGEPGALVGAGAPGLVVVRSLTKLWAIPGVRAGYVVGDPALVDELR